MEELTPQPQANWCLFSSSQDVPLEGDAGPSSTYLLPSGALGVGSLSRDSLEEKVTPAPPSPAQSGEERQDPELDGTTPSVRPGPVALSTLLPEEPATKLASLPRKKLSSLKQANSSRKQLRPKATSAAGLPRAGSQPASPGLGLPSSATEKPGPPGDPDPVASEGEETFRLPSSEEPLWLDRRRGAVPTTPAPLQISPFTSQPYVAHTLPQRPDPGEPVVPDEAQEAPLEDASPMTLMDKGENELTGSASEESQETTTSTIITTTVITTEQAPGMRPPAPPPAASLRHPQWAGRGWAGRSRPHHPLPSIQH